VGESGSGKSVTARSIMGIQAGNSITEGGEIFFGGQDLTKITEHDYHQLRGNRISMIFQDPFSSLNPIMKIGKQLTEAMILNGRINRRETRHNFSKRLKALKLYVAQAVKGGKTAENFALLKKFSLKGSEMEKVYNGARESIVTQVTAIEGILIDLIRGEPHAIVRDINIIIKRTAKCYHRYLVKRESSPLPGLLGELKTACAAYMASRDNSGVKVLLGKIKGLFADALEMTTPDFFAIGYYATCKPGANIDTGDIAALNETMGANLSKGFLDAFLGDISAGLKLSTEQFLRIKKITVDKINAGLPLFDNDSASSAELKRAIKALEKTVDGSIDPLVITRDSFAFSFRSGCDAALERYLLIRESKNLLEAEDLQTCRENIRAILVRLRDEYQAEINGAAETNYALLARQTVDRLKADSSRMVYRVTNSMARSRAISLMEEVGIPEARDRYRQYPFQFSGGMRQRVVIAIALAANPDILICDEPSTALDVTIQAQILALLNNLKEKRQLSIIFITHDLGVVANVADHIAVMYAGKIVEHGTVDEVFYEPAHPYTWALLASMPDLNTTEKLEAIPGTPPNMIHPPLGDAFAARNKYAMEIDFEEEPPFFDVSLTHKAATWLLHPDAPKVEPPRIVTERIALMRKMEEEENGGTF